MKLRNKKTGEIVNVASNFGEGQGIVVFADIDYHYASLAELNEEWEDYEEPKVYWYINSYGEVEYDEKKGYDIEKLRKQFGNYFETKEQAEKAVEKLKAWKRLKDKGIKVIDRGWEKVNNINREDDGVIYIKILFDTKTYDCSWDDDLDLLFGGEE